MRVLHCPSEIYEVSCTSLDKRGEKKTEHQTKQNKMKASLLYPIYFHWTHRITFQPGGRVRNLMQIDVIVGKWGMNVLVGRRVQWWWFNLGEIYCLLVGPTHKAVSVLLI